MACVEDNVYIVDVRKVGTFKFNISSVVSEPTGTLELISCSPIPVAPFTSQNAYPRGFISAVTMKGKIYSMYSRDFLLDYHKLEGSGCPKVCVYDPAESSWGTLDDTPAFATLACTMFADEQSMQLLTVKTWKRWWAYSSENKKFISFSKLISDGNDLLLYQHQNPHFDSHDHLYALYKYSMEEKSWKAFSNLPNVLQDTDDFDGKNIIIDDLIPSTTVVCKTYEGVPDENHFMLKMTATEMENNVWKKLNNSARSRYLREDSGSNGLYGFNSDSSDSDFF